MGHATGRQEKPPLQTMRLVTTAGACAVTKPMTTYARLKGYVFTNPTATPETHALIQLGNLLVA